MDSGYGSRWNGRRDSPRGIIVWTGTHSALGEVTRAGVGFISIVHSKYIEIRHATHTPQTFQRNATHETETRTQPHTT